MPINVLREPVKHGNEGPAEDKMSVVLIKKVPISVKFLRNIIIWNFLRSGYIGKYLAELWPLYFLLWIMKCHSAEYKNHVMCDECGSKFNKSFFLWEIIMNLGSKTVLHYNNKTNYNAYLLSLKIIHNDIQNVFSYIVK